MRKSADSKTLQPWIILLAVGVAASSVFADDYPVAPFSGPLNASSFHKVVGVGATVPSVATAFTSTRLAGVEGSNTAFTGAYTDPVAQAARSGLFSAAADGTISLLAGPGSVTPGGESISTIVGNGEWIDGQITFAADTTAGQKLYRVDTTTGVLTTLVSAGQTLGNSESPISTFGKVAGDASGYAFSAKLGDNSQAMYQSNGSGADSVLKISDDKTRAPGSSEFGVIVDFPEVAYRTGLTAYVPRALETDSDTPVAEPIGVVLAMPGNPDRLPVYKTGAIPGSPDEEFRFTEFEKPRLFERAGEKLLGFTGGFIEEEDPNSDEHYMGVFTQGDGGWKNWINSDIPLPGLRADIEEFNGFGLDESFFAAGAVDEDNGRYIFAEINGKFEYILSTYDQLDGKSISSIRWVTDVMNGAELHFTAEFTDGTNGVYTVIVPEPTTLAIVAATSVLLRRRRSR